MTTTGHGGARSGAGRPEAGTVAVLLRLKRATAKALARAARGQPVGTKSRIADEAIRLHLRRGAERFADARNTALSGKEAAAGSGYAQKDGSP